MNEIRDFAFLGLNVLFPLCRVVIGRLFCIPWDGGACMQRLLVTPAGMTGKRCMRAPSMACETTCRQPRDGEEKELMTKKAILKSDSFCSQVKGWNSKYERRRVQAEMVCGSSAHAVRLHKPWWTKCGSGDVFHTFHAWFGLNMKKARENKMDGGWNAK